MPEMVKPPLHGPLGQQPGADERGGIAGVDAAGQGGDQYVSGLDGLLLAADLDRHR
uniref:hypothetical protein n=1 Tax=Bifidobacterium aemilianum TaxID=2493120 RepID=UPI00137508E1